MVFVERSLVTGFIVLLLPGLNVGIISPMCLTHALTSALHGGICSGGLQAIAELLEVDDIAQGNTSQQYSMTVTVLMYCFRWTAGHR